MKANRGRGGRMTLNARFSSAPKTKGIQNASKKNQLLAKQMENRPTVRAALSQVTKQTTKAKRGAKIAQAVKIGVKFGQLGGVSRGGNVKRGGAIKRGGGANRGRQQRGGFVQSNGAGPYQADNSRRPVMGTPQSALVNQPPPRKQQQQPRGQNVTNSKRPVTGTPQSALQQQGRPQQKQFKKKQFQPQQDSRRPVTGTPQFSLPQAGRSAPNRGRGGFSRGQRGGFSRGGGRPAQNLGSIKGRLSIKGRISKPIGQSSFAAGGRLGGFSSRGRGGFRGSSRGRGGFGFSKQW